MYLSAKTKGERKDCAKWISNKILKMLTRYALCFLAVLALDLILLRDHSIANYLFDFVTLTIPTTTSWFLKVIILLYIFTMIPTLVFGKPKYTTAIVGLLTMLCMALFIWRGFESKWWLCMSCYWLGMVWAKYGERVYSAILRLGDRAVYFVGGVLFILEIIYRQTGLIWGNKYTDIFWRWILCLALFTLIKYSRANKISEIIEIIGDYSLEIYLVHTGFLFLLEQSEGVNGVAKFISATAIGLLAVILIIKMNEKRRQGRK